MSLIRVTKSHPKTTRTFSFKTIFSHFHQIFSSKWCWQVLFHLELYLLNYFSFLNHFLKMNFITCSEWINSLTRTPFLSAVFVLPLTADVRVNPKQDSFSWFSSLLSLQLPRFQLSSFIINFVTKVSPHPLVRTDRPSTEP